MPSGLMCEPTEPTNELVLLCQGLLNLMVFKETCLFRLLHTLQSITTSVYVITSKRETSSYDHPIHPFRMDPDIARSPSSSHFFCDQWDRHPTRTVLATVFVIFVLCRVYETARRYRRLRHFKGPPLAAVSKLWLLKTVTGSLGHLEFYNVTKKYSE